MDLKDNEPEIPSEDQFIFFLKRYNDTINSIADEANRQKFMNFVLLMTLKAIKKVNPKAWEELRGIVDQS